MTTRTGPPVRRRCGSCGALGPVVDVRDPLAACGVCGAGPTFGDRVARVGSERWALTLVGFWSAVVVLLVLVFLLT